MATIEFKASATAGYAVKAVAMRIADMDVDAAGNGEKAAWKRYLALALLAMAKSADKAAMVEAIFGKGAKSSIASLGRQPDAGARRSAQGSLLPEGSKRASYKSFEYRIGHQDAIHGIEHNSAFNTMSYDRRYRDGEPSASFARIDRLYPIPNAASREAPFGKSTTVAVLRPPLNT